MEKVKNFCVSAAFTVGTIVAGFFCWTLFWALFMLFVGGGPIPRHCADNSTHLPGLIVCVQRAFAREVLQMLVEGVVSVPSAIPNANYTRIIKDMHCIVYTIGKSVHKIGEGALRLARLPADVFYEDYTTRFIIRDGVYAGFDVMRNFIAMFTICHVPLPEEHSEIKN